MLNLIILGATFYWGAECHYAVCRYVDWRGAIAHYDILGLNFPARMVAHHHLTAEYLGTFSVHGLNPGKPY